MTKDPVLTSSRLAPRLHAAALFAAMAIALALLVYRNAGLNPLVFADEWLYSKMSRLTPLADAIVPSYLYLWVFKGSNACGDGFYDCVRFGNALFFVGAAPFVYLIAREVTGPRLALCAAVLALLAPLNLFATFFMPESMYYFGFCVLSWVALTRAHWHPAAYGLVTGALLGLLSLVKIHALFLLPALCLFVLYAVATRDGQGRRLAAGLLAAVLCAAAMACVKFGLGYLLAGPAGATLFGPFYGAGASQSASNPLARLLAAAFINARGHLMTLAVLLAVPLAALVQLLVSRAARAAAGARLVRQQLYALLMLGAALGMTIAFTASIAGTGPDEVLRLHTRYYSFVFPLLFIGVAAQLGRAGPGQQAAASWPIALPVGLALAAAAIFLPRYVMHLTDGPDIAGLDLNDWTWHALVALDVLALVLWAWNSKIGAALSLFGALPLTMLVANYNQQDFLAHNLRVPSGLDNAGRFAHRYVPRAEHKDITLAGLNQAELYRVQFHLDDKDAALLELPRGAAIEGYQVPVHGKWLLVVGDHALPPGIKPVAATSEYALVRLAPHGRPAATAELGQPVPGPVLAEIAGLSHSEGWGRWSDSKQVVVRFQRPLPKRMTLILTANAFGVNTTLPFTIHVGASSSTFRLGASPQEIALPFTTDGDVRNIVIDVPRPQAPSELGQMNDVRKLGIAVSKIEVDEAGVGNETVVSSR
jgi:phosphoglycerol transferase